MGVTLLVDEPAGPGPSDSRDLHSMLQWLRRERIPGILVDPAPTGPGEEEMGALVDALTVVGSSGTGVALAGALRAWILTRRPGVVIRVKDGSGREFAIDVGAAGNADEALSRFLDRALSEGSAEQASGES